MAEEVANARAIRDWANGKFLEKTGETAKADGMTLTDIKFGIDSEGNYGYYKTGADTVTPFKSGGNGFPSSIDYTPFPSYGVSDQYGCYRIAVQNFSKEECERMSRLVVNGKLYMSGGSSSLSCSSYLYVVFAATDGEKQYYLNSNGSFVTASVSGDKFTLQPYKYDRISGSATSFTSQTVAYDIDVSTIQQTLKSQGLEFGSIGSHVIAGTGSSIISVPLPNIFVYMTFQRPSSTTSGYKYYGFSVNSSKSTAGYDSYSDFQNNPPQIRAYFS